MVTLKHGDLIWIDLSPYLDKRVLAKFVDYLRFYKIKTRSGIIPYDSALRIYDIFYDELEFDITLQRTNKLLCNPVTYLWVRTAEKFMKIVGKENVNSKEMTLFDLREMPNEFRWSDDDYKEKYSDLYYQRNYEIISAKDGLPYKKIGEYKIGECGHLDYSVSMGSFFYARTRIYIEFLKRYEPERLKYNLFGKLPEYVTNPENGGDDCFVYTRYARMPLLESIPVEHRYKAFKEE